jgi:hypothetical protein
MCLASFLKTGTVVSFFIVLVGCGGGGSASKNKNSSSVNESSLSSVSSDNSSSSLSNLSSSSLSNLSSSNASSLSSSSVSSAAPNAQLLPYAQVRHDVVEHDGKLWLLGVGSENDSILNPSHGIWNSTDGFNWVPVTISLPSNEIFRLSFNIVSFKDKLWMISGDYLADGLAKNIFESDMDSDVFSWVDVTNESVFSSRVTQPVVFNNKLWVIGGEESATTFKNDIWSSVDGVEWVQESAEAGFSARKDHQVVFFKDKLWLIGGNNDGFHGEKDVWSSVDGVNWVEVTTNAAFGLRDGHQVISFNDKLWLIGGVVSTPGEDDSFIRTRANDIWSSIDGINWVEEVEDAPFSARSNHQLVVFSSTIFLMGGFDGSTAKNDVWSSTDGINWR